MTESIPNNKKPNINDWTLEPLRGCLFLTGPTSSGKTPLAVHLARHLNAEIISLDSMAIYQDMDLGTAKPTVEERAGVPHHLIDMVPPTESFSVSSYVLEAHRVAADIQARGKRVLVCGGTPLYLKSLLRGMFLGPEADWEFREAVERDLQAFGQEALLERLRQVDPLSSHKIHPHDHRRIIRALEVAKVTGKPLSHWQQQFEDASPQSDFPVAVLRLDRAWLHERINQRVDGMIHQGLVKEVEGLLAKYSQLGRTAAQAVGYREISEHLDGKLELDEATQQIKAHTRQFARRQEIWFRGLQELQPVAVTPNDDIPQIAEAIMGVFAAGLTKEKHADN